MPRARLGVALLVPPPLDREVDGLRRAAGDGSLARIPAHITLVPPVNVREERLGDALAVLRRAAAATAPLALVLGPPDTFLPATPVLYLAVGGEVDALRALRDGVFQEPLARPLTWPWVPHVTLADEARPQVLDAAVTAMAGYRVEARFDRVHLLEERRGRVWEPVADAAFARPAVVARGGLPLALTVSDGLDPEAEAFSRREGEAALRERWGAAWHRDRAFAVVARREGRVVGTAAGWSRGPDAELDWLVVGHGERGEGIGSHLLARVVSLAGERDCRRIVCTTPAGEGTERFLVARGWVVDARLPQWRAGVDFVRLRRDLV